MFHIKPKEHIIIVMKLTLCGMLYRHWLFTKKRCHTSRSKAQQSSVARLAVVLTNMLVYAEVLFL